LIGSAFGLAPSSTTFPVTEPAFDSSTFCPDGVAAGALGAADSDDGWDPPPQAAETASATIAENRIGRGFSLASKRLIGCISGIS
jgi:hypothetical protein